MSYLYGSGLGAAPSGIDMGPICAAECDWRYDNSGPRSSCRTACGQVASGGTCRSACEAQGMNSSRTDRCIDACYAAYTTAGVVPPATSPLAELLRIRGRTGLLDARQLLPGVTRAAAQRTAECNTLCQQLAAQYPNSYASVQGCRTQCEANPAQPPIASICAHRYVGRPGAIAACVAQAGAPVIANGGEVPVVEAGMGWKWFLVAGAVLGVGYLGYQWWKKGQRA